MIINTRYTDDEIYKWLEQNLPEDQPITLEDDQIELFLKSRGQ